MTTAIVFNSRTEFKEWLARNYDRHNGIWVEFQKGNAGFTAGDALEEALCFGWIDGKIKGKDEKSYYKYFAKRRGGSRWSDKNKLIVNELIEKGLMAAPGIRAIEDAKKNGVWEKPEEGNRKGLWLDELKEALEDHKEILGMFEKLPPSRKMQYAGFYCEAKSIEVRKKRLGKIIDHIGKSKKGILY